MLYALCSMLYARCLAKSGINNFTVVDRTAFLNKLTDTHWDLLIIGGGITGAGILLDAVSRGLSAALIEMGDFASGTSSRSTKLIHGGLRYLKNFEIGLVREVGRERAILHANARHLVRPEPMLLPIYHDGSIGRITGSIGLWFYDLLADVGKTERRKMLSREEILEREPLLKRDGLLGGGLYYEYRTDDARLTLSIIRKAVELGGCAINYCKANGFKYVGSQITGVTATEILAQKELSIDAHVVVNATGPWMDTISGLQKHDGPVPKRVLLTKGVHIVVPKDRCPISQSMYFDVAEDGRMIFCIPRDRAVYIGTTDTVYDGSLAELPVEEHEVRYLLRSVNHVLESRSITRTDVTGVWAGVRPLIFEEDKAPSELSRKDEIYTSMDGLISIAGGKLTGYRKMAERILDLVIKSDHLKNKTLQPCRTHDIHIMGSEFDSDVEMQSKLKECISMYSAFTSRDIEKLFYRYGSETLGILKTSAEIQEGPDMNTLIGAEVMFSLQKEMTTCLEDFILRRTSDLFFDQEYVKRNLKAIVSVFGNYLHWDKDTTARQLSRVVDMLQSPVISYEYLRSPK